MVAGESSRLLGTLGILKEALCFPTRNEKNMVPIILLMLVTFCILSLASNLLLTPVARELVSKMAHFPKDDPNSPKTKEIADEILEDIQSHLAMEAYLCVAICIISMFWLVSKVHSKATTYASTNSTYNDLLDMMRIGGPWKWKCPVITSFYVSLISTAYSLLKLGSIIFITVVPTVGVILSVFYVLVNFSAPFLYFYFTIVWIMGLVSSIIEEDCYGMKAGELQGRNFRGLALMLLLSITTIAIIMVHLYVANVMKQVTAAQLETWATMFCLVCLVKVFMYVVNTVFYSECNKINKEKTYR